MCAKPINFTLTSNLKTLLQRYKPLEIDYLLLESLKDLLSRIGNENDVGINKLLFRRKCLVLGLLIENCLKPVEITNLNLDDVSYDIHSGCWKIIIRGKETRVVPVTRELGNTLTGYLELRKLFLGTNEGFSSLILAKPLKGSSGKLIPRSITHVSISSILKSESKKIFNGCYLTPKNLLVPCISRELEANNSIENIFEVSKKFGISVNTLLETYLFTSQLGLNFKNNIVNHWKEEIVVHEWLDYFVNKKEPYDVLNKALSNLQTEIKKYRRDKKNIKYLFALRSLIIINFLKFYPIRVSELSKLKVKDIYQGRVTILYRGNVRVFEISEKLQYFTNLWISERERLLNDEVSSFLISKFDSGNIGPMKLKGLMSFVQNTLFMKHDFSSFSDFTLYRQLFFVTELKKESSLINLLYVCNILGISVTYGISWHRAFINKGLL